MLFPVTSHTHWYTTPTTRVAKAMPKRFKRGKKRVRFSVGAEESDGVVQEESEVMEVVEQEEEGDSSGEEDEAEDIRQMVLQQNRRRKRAAASSPWVS